MKKKLNVELVDDFGGEGVNIRLGRSHDEAVLYFA